MILFRVDGEPKGQPRPRAFSRNGKARVYDPGTAEGWRGLISAAARPELPAEPISGPVRLDVEFAMPRPQRLCRRRDDPGAIPHTSKPDLDNLLKALLDALTQLGLWRDDDQVVEVRAVKHYHELGGRPGALVAVREVEP